MSGGNPQIWLISGNSEAGKTSFCRKAIAKAMEMGCSVAGVLSPAVFEDGGKIGIDVQDAGSGQARRLANLQKDDPNSITPHWKFDQDALHWGSGVLAASIPCDVLVVDELGPLELEHDQGWIEGIRAIDSRQYRLALVVVRSALLSNALARWPGARVHTIARTDAAVTADRGIDDILQYLSN